MPTWCPSWSRSPATNRWNLGTATTRHSPTRASGAKGGVAKSAFAGGPARFEKAPEGHHDHLIDVETGEVIEFASEAIEALQEEIARRLGYEIVTHRLELYGRRIRGR